MATLLDAGQIRINMRPPDHEPGCGFTYELQVTAIGKHFVCYVGCQKAVVHDADEMREWLSGLFDQHIRPFVASALKTISEEVKTA